MAKLAGLANQSADHELSFKNFITFLNGSHDDGIAHAHIDSLARHLQALIPYLKSFQSVILKTKLIIVTPGKLSDVCTAIEDGNQLEKLRMIQLSSRQTLCINQEVNLPGRSITDIDSDCNSRIRKRFGCPFYKGPNNNYIPFFEDIEDTLLWFDSKELAREGYVKECVPTLLFTRWRLATLISLLARTST